MILSTAKPATLSRADSLSSRTQLTVQWVIESDTEIPITGYALEWDSGNDNNVFTTLWNGEGRPDITQFSVVVQTGSRYSFRHKALNGNGESEYSDVFVTYACESPSAPTKPQWTSSTTT